MLENKTKEVLKKGLVNTDPCERNLGKAWIGGLAASLLCKVNLGF